jgi:hypothetical protein
MKLKLTLIAFFLWAIVPAEAALFHSVNVLQQPKKLTESQKIESLIAFIAKQEGVFLRNGGEYTPGQAAEHLRMKWKKGGSAINTAEMFIEKLATTSSVSGKPYQIRLKNGQTVNLAPMLRAELKRLNQ